MKVKAFGLTDIGRVRDENQDAFLIDERHRFYAVADGLGGLPGGAYTSRRIVELLKERMHQLNAGKRCSDLTNLIININQIISRESIDAYPLTGSGSTLTVCQIVDQQLLIGHVGDSAAYLLRDEDLKKLTIDHTMEQELVDQHGEAARIHMPPEYPHTLTRCVGQGAELRVDQTRVELQAEDRILLCTDGLSKVLSESEIAQALASDLSPEEISSKLTRQANAQSGRDNITVITLILE